MLTVKHVLPGDKEVIYEAADVTFKAKALADSAGRSASKGSVWCGGGDQPIAIYDGTVYVMNASGSTVAKYELGGLPKNNERNCSDFIPKQRIEA